MRYGVCAWFVCADMDDSGFLEGEVADAGDDVTMGDTGEQSQGGVESPELLE